MANTFYLYTHLGLGDIIICNGLIREVCKIKPHVTIFCKPRYEQSVKYMLRDLQNLSILIKDDYDIQLFLSNVPSQQKYWVGFNNLDKYSNKFTFDEKFYKQIGLNFQKRWSSFYVDRDLTLENFYYKKLAPKQPYAFVHDDSSRGHNIDNNLISKELLIFRPPVIPNIFGYCKIIEQSSEIHCMDSCFKVMIDSIFPNKNGLYHHINMLQGTTKTQQPSKSKLDWIIK
jgi:hypothetical protein